MEEYKSRKADLKGLR